VKVCLDTQILVWGIREACTNGQENNIAYAKALIKQLRSDGHQIIVPSIVIGEMLMALPIEHHPLVMNLLDMACTCVPFDTGCAGQFAKIWQLNKGNGIIDELKNEIKEGSKHELKADCLIVATAIRNSVDLIYSNDKKFRRFAEGHVKVEDLPQLSMSTNDKEQLSLFTYQLPEDSISPINA
jgi:predicted nucleic acid-binding protein